MPQNEIIVLQTYLNKDLENIEKLTEEEIKTLNSFEKKLKKTDSDNYKIFELENNKIIKTT